MVRAEYSPEFNLVLVSIAGSYSLQSFMDECAPIVERLANDHPGPPVPNRLYDFRAMQFSVGTKELRQVATWAKGFTEWPNQPAKIAYLVDRDLAYGLLRQFEAFADSGVVERQVFRKLDEALTWLGIDPSRGDALPLVSTPPGLRD